MQCELCGKESEILYNAVVEGIMLSVCKRCSSFGNVVRVEKPRFEKPTKSKTAEKQPPEEVIVDDFPARIRNAREKRALTQEKLAVAIAEKESLIHKIESGSMPPSLQLARKLEQFLKIKLVDQIDPPSRKSKKKLDFKDSSLTIGDLISLKK